MNGKIAFAEKWTVKGRTKMAMTREEEEVMKLVAEWYSLALGAPRLPETSYFRFLALWVAFNGLYSLRFPLARTEKTQITSFGNWSKAKAAHAEAISANDPAYRNAVGVLRQQGVFNFLTGKTENVRDEKDLQEVISLVYRVRCNLFHGRKVPSNLRDRKLVEAAHAIVSELMSRIVQLPSTRARAV